MKAMYDSEMMGVQELLDGVIDELLFEQDDSEGVMNVEMYLDGKHYFYKFTEYDDNDTVGISLIRDEETIDAMYEDLDNLHYMGLSLEEEKFMALVTKLRQENKHNFSKFMTKKQMLDVRWDLMKYMTEVDIDVYYSKGLVVIH